jgi:hypothetical protein
MRKPFLAKLTGYYGITPRTSVSVNPDLVNKKEKIYR